MKSVHEAVEALCQLSTTDREWVLGALSVSARKKLRDLAAAQHGAAAERSDDPISLETADTSVVEQLLEASPALAVSRVRSEPPWMLALILNERTWPWQEALLTALAPDKRLEVAQLRTRLPRPSSRMREALLRALSAQVFGATAGTDGNAPFEQALGRARFRTWRRG